MYNLELRSPVWNNGWDKEFDRLFSSFKSDDVLAPACEIADSEKFYSISLDMPGMRSEDLDIEVKEDHLYINGERKNERSDKDNVVRSERRYGKFARIFSLPKDVKSDGIEAHFENGVLEITLPKEEKARPKKISIMNSQVSQKKDVKAELAQ